MNEANFRFLAWALTVGIVIQVIVIVALVLLR